MSSPAITVAAPWEILAAEYPHLFGNVRCGVSIGPGWLPIMRWWADEVTKRGATVTVEQVKEKFGGLRIYTSGDDVEDLTAIAEYRASKTCEWCGDKGEAVMGSWLKTLCDGCQAEWEERHG